METGGFHSAYRYVKKIELLVESLNKLYGTVVDLLSDPSNKDAVEQKANQIDARFEEYSNTKAQLVHEFGDENTEDINQQYDKEVKCYQEIKHQINEWKLNMPKFHKRPVLAPRSTRSVRSKKSTTSRKSARTTCSGSTNASRREAVRAKEYAKLRKQQIAEKLELEDQQKLLENQQKELEKRAKLMEAEHEYQAACLEAEIYENADTDDLSTVLDSDDDADAIDDIRSEYKTLPKQNYSKCNETTIERKRIETRKLPHVNPILEVPRRVMYEPPLINRPEMPVRPVTGTGITADDLANAMMTSMNMPKVELLKFDGSYNQFMRFKESFTLNITDKISDNAKRLVLLQQYCEGKPRELISNCSMYPPEEGFQVAMSILEKRYGNPIITARKCIDELVDGPQLKTDDAEALMDFANKMQECYLTLKNLEKASELNNFKDIVKLATRLPSKYHTKWEDLSSKIESEHLAEVTFLDLLKFVEKIAQSANSSMRRAMQAYKEKEKAKQPLKKKVYATSTETVNDEISRDGETNVKKMPLCVACQEEHLIIECEVFAKMSVADRRETVKKARLCNNCFHRGHIARDCQKYPKCKVTGCGKKHHTLLHIYHVNESSETNTTSTVPKATVASTKLNDEASGVYLNIVPVKVSARNGKELEIYCFIDEGSTCSLCDKSLLDLLGISGRPRKFTITTVSDPEPKPQEGYVIDLKVKSLDGKGHVSVKNVLTVDSLPVKANKLPSKSELRKYEYLDGIEFPKISNGKVMLMIGTDVPQVMWIIDQRRGKPSQAIAKKTCLGWSLIGNSLQGKANVSNFHVQHMRVHDDLQQQINDLWNTDFKDIALTPVPTMSKEDKYAMKLSDESVNFSEGRYIAPLLWKPGCPNFPDNRESVKRRTLNLGKRLKKDDDLKKKYCAKMAEFIEKGWARVIPENELEGPKGKVWYLPHQPVVSENKPGKVRLVHDCSATYMGTSLNEQLMHGADLANSLLKVLLNFRFHEYGIIADVQSMFLQVKIFPDDCHSLRFLFWPNGDLNKDPVDHEMMVNLFGSTCASFLANYCLKRTAKDFGEEFSPDIQKNVEHAAYVDDFLLGAPSIEDGKRIIEQTQLLVSRGGFHLTKWQSNCPEILSHVPESERASSSSEVNLEQNQVERALGVKWFLKEDAFGFNIKLKTKPNTKRGILSYLNSIFDPIGMISPVTIQARILFQELCRQKLDWDETINDNEMKVWQKWTANIADLQDIKLPRCVKPKSKGKIVIQELHHFGDASQLAYGVVSYMRLVNDQGQIHCAFLLSKARLCPIKATSIPRLELTAAALCVKVDIFLRRELNFDDDTKSIFWTDSTSTLQSIYNSTTRFPTFVANRLAKIEEGSSPIQWRFVPGEINPSDLVTRGVTPGKLLQCEEWFNAPKFLYENENAWPAAPVDLPELPPEFIKKTAVQVNATQITGAQPLEKFVNYYSSWYKLKKATAWMLRFKDYLQKIPRLGQLKVEEMQNAEQQLIKYVQADSFPDTIKKLESSKNSGGTGDRKVAMPMQRLNPMLTNGILRVGGRLRNAPVEFDCKYPIILPSKHHLTELIVHNYHKTSHHGGPGHTWTMIRQKYWILNGGAVVRKVIGNCIMCKKRNAPASKQFMSDLPKERLARLEPPFTHVGVDNFGHFLVKQGRSSVKRWGLIITCATTRAVHLEVVYSLDVDSFINALRRFIARRGKMSTILCDNGMNFVAGDKMMRKELHLWNSSKFGTFCLQEEIKFKFNPPAASHFGGFYERLIRSTRRVLSTLLHGHIGHLLTDELLTTIFCEVESQLNSRPLTPISMDPKSEEPMSPNHLLLLNHGSNLPPGLFNKDDCYSRKRWKQVQYLADQFWRRWTQEYLPTLQQRQKWNYKQENLRINDLVLIVDNMQPRGRWETARVVDTIQDKFGNVRQVTVKTPHGLMKRPIAKLCLIHRASFEN